MCADERPIEAQLLDILIRLQDDGDAAIVRLQDDFKLATQCAIRDIRRLLKEREHDHERR